MSVRPRMLITGCKGQVGWELNRSLAAIGDVIALDRNELDLGNADAIRSKIRELRPDWIFNAAAYTAVDAAEREQELARTINGIAPGVLAEEASLLGGRLIHFSTDYVFDGTATRPYRESDPVSPCSVYGSSKLQGEQRALQGNPHTWVFRTSWVYASRGRNFLLTMLRLARQQPRLRVVDDQIGSPTPARQIANAIAAFTAAELRHARVPSGVYHLTSPGQTSWHGFACRIVEWAAERGLCPPVPVDAITSAEYPTPARRPAWSVLDCGLIDELAGIALPQWEHGLHLCLEELEQTR